jgi:hypothetical protein
MSNASRVFIFTLVGLLIGTAQGYGEPADVILLANSIDYALAQDFVDYLKDKGFGVTRVEAAAFDAYKTSQFIVILGGPDAPEGVGSIVQQHLSTQEQEHLRISGNRKMYLKSYQSQRVFVIAGSDRTQTRETHIENRVSLYEAVMSQTQPEETPKPPIPKEGTTLFAGEYAESISYWGYTRSNGYTTVRLQTRGDYPLVYFTFKELPSRIQLEGIEYDVLYYDDERIIIKKIG